LAFKSGLKRVATGWHVDGLADIGSASSDEGASAPTAGLPGDWREAGETCSLACLEGAELRHFDEQGEGGYGLDARNAGEDCEPLGEIGVSSDLLEDCRLDRRHLAIDLFEALRILTPQQGGGQNLAAVLGGGAVLHQGFAGEVKLLEREQSVAAGRPLLKLQHCTHARQHRCIQAVGFRQTADRLGEAARLTRIDHGVRNAGRAQGDFESAVIGTGRFEHDALHRPLHKPFDERPMAAPVVGETSALAVAQAMSVEMAFRDIDAEGIVLHLFRAFACRSGLAPEYPCRPKEKTRAIQL
jgi:hypothetical protein